ncbi:MAG: DUF1415 domain-containing protein [Betaproteobacteria bacterium]
MTDEAVVEVTQVWLDRVVIGLELCPFAAAVRRDGRIRFVASPADSVTALQADLVRELRLLAATAASEIETTLLIHPRVLGDFLAFNDFLDTVDVTIAGLALEGEIQVASFHPRYRFAGTAPDAIENCTNRSPHPTLHLLREASIERAVAAFGRTEAIYERNIETLRHLGRAGWQRLADTPPETKPG